ncbi:hypothetical protein BKA66DRAFT_9521 [Pyrenochaeta sp. MPI-SDFR-AT-0127]|nr:hypothetical protein BKA66DRAFT_9521 [Pyrenochaeta sp. MPI-SDFR-AT-0127]
MTSSTRRASHEEQPRVTIQATRTPAPATWFRGLQHPFVAFAIPLVVLFCSPALYRLAVPSSSLRHIDEHKLQEIASLLDDIYATFVKITFIPPTAVKRGPHWINTTAIPCERDPNVLRLMEIMPYVDSIEVEEENEVQRTDWLFGGEFLDYRQPHHLVKGCNPLRGKQVNSYMTPATVALTSWRTGEWNNDRTFVFLYDVLRNSIRIFKGDRWVTYRDEDEPYSTGRHTGHDPDREIWFDAPTLLRRVLGAYQSLAWTPWETSNREDWGVDVNIIKKLLRKNGWPNSFDSDQFNADFFRAKYSPCKRGPAEAAYRRIEELEGKINQGEDKEIGYIEHSKQAILSYEDQIQNELDEQERWVLVVKAQLKRWEIARHEAELKAAKEEVGRLCPDGMCVKDEDVIVWEFYSMEKEYEKAQRALPPKKTCEWDLTSIVDWDPPDPVLYRNCVTKRKREAYWLQLAYTQFKTETLQHCAETGCTLLPQPTLEELVSARIQDLEEHIIHDQTRAVTMYDWRPTLPEHAEKAQILFEMEASGAANGPWYIRDLIDDLKKRLVDGSDKARLWRCIDDPNRVC